MKPLFRLFVTVLLLAGWGLAAASLHLVRVPGTFTLVTKDEIGIKDTYVDTTQWTLAQAAEHPGVVRRLLATGKTDLLAHVDNGETGDPLRLKLMDALDGQLPATAPAAPLASVGPGASADSAKATERAPHRPRLFN